MEDQVAASDVDQREGKLSGRDEAERILQIEDISAPPALLDVADVTTRLRFLAVFERDLSRLGLRYRRRRT